MKEANEHNSHQRGAHGEVLRHANQGVIDC